MNPLNRAFLILFTIVVYTLFVWISGRSHERKSCDAEKASVSLQTQSIKSDSETSSKQVIERVVYKDRIIKEKADVVTKTITKYVPSNNCSLDDEWVHLHNVGAKGELPKASSRIYRRLTYV